MLPSPTFTLAAELALRSFKNQNFAVNVFVLVTAVLCVSSIDELVSGNLLHIKSLFLQPKFANKP